ncbi:MULTISPECIES: YdbL family protein [Oceanimonas]|uniref:YdbL family protein n=1 Tax=Oceanimonas smirnovii TaxID=264574 RepID=A0ABW7NZR3_9GAMM|nr:MULTISPECIES: YdbL family protein [Oceanimonas]MDV2857786.1 YdbL family protein [Oceanimonas sp. CAM02]
MRWLAMILAATLSLSAWALDLQQAKQQGLIGEQVNGLVGAVQGGAQVSAIVNDINRKRLDSYRDIAQKTGTSLTIVQSRAGQLNIDRTPPGQYVQLADGRWQRK